MEIIKNTFRLYAITLILPMVTTIGIIMFSILGIGMRYEFLEALKVAWVDYYYSGHLGGIQAFKIHLAFLFMCFLYSIAEELN